MKSSFPAEPAGAVLLPYARQWTWLRCWGEACGFLVSSLLPRGFLEDTILLSAGASRHSGGHHR